MKAWQVIERYGWVQHIFGNECLGMCVAQALYKAYPVVNDRLEQHRKLLTFLGGVEPINWNDDPNRTKEEVITTLKQLDI